MGAILAKFRKKPSTMEVLEGIDKDIDSLIKLKQKDVQLEKQYVGSLMLWSGLGYLAMALLFYFYYWGTSWQERVFQIMPLLLFPVLIWGVRKVLRWYFVKRIAKNQVALGDLRDKKKKILEDVKETESYKKAKEILDRFDPAPTPKPASNQATPIGTPVPRLRQRPMTARGARTPNTPRSPPRQPGLAPMLTPQQQLMLRPPPTARPILARERGTFDKLVDFVVGDGPGSRYALICKHCYSHNGMAMQEEFEYLAFKCAYCSTFNPSRKIRPNAPQLPVATPLALRSSANAAQGAIGSAGSRSGSEDNQSDAETAVRSESTSDRENTSDAERREEASTSTKEEIGEPSTSASTENAAVASAVADVKEEEPSETGNVNETSDVDEDLRNNTVENNEETLQRLTLRIGRGRGIGRGDRLSGDFGKANRGCGRGREGRGRGWKVCERADGQE